MTSWLAGSVALPRPVALGTLGVRVMVERKVVRGRVDEGEGAVVEEGLMSGVTEDAGVEMGELRLDEDGEDLAVPLAWLWICVWLWISLRLRDSNWD